MIKGTVYKEDFKQILTDIKAERGKNTVRVRDFNAPISMMDTTHRQKINKDPMDMNNTVNPVDLTNMYRTVLPICSGMYILLKCTWKMMQG